jgi:hypothetical protein
LKWGAVRLIFFVFYCVVLILFYLLI